MDHTQYEVYIQHLKLTHAQKETLLKASLEAERKFSRECLWGLGCCAFLFVAFILNYVVCK